MKKTLLTILLALSAAPLGAQKPGFEAGGRFETSIINDEFDVSQDRYAASGTLAAVKLSPYVGLRIRDSHALVTGVSLIKDFGTPGEHPFAEWTVWYQYGRRGLTFAAGIFPRALLKGRYSTFILSDAARFYDNNLEGFAIRYSKGRFLGEIALDWNGKFGETRREQFNVISAGEYRFTGWMSACWEGMFHHYACSGEFSSVVDDHIFHPYVSFDAASGVSMQRLRLDVGAVMGYQKDRLTGEGSHPFGADIVLDAAKWGFGIRGEVYYGDAQNALYNSPDESGTPYGSALYMRSSIWQKSGFYGRGDLYWGKSLCKEVWVGVRFAFHFGEDGYLGCQQFLQARVNLSNIRIK